MNRTLRIILEDSIDYAGMFPPAALDLPSAAEQYSSYRCGADSWALGRFVISANKLEELERVLAKSGAADGEAAEGRHEWGISALLGLDAEADLARIRQFNVARRGAGGNARVETVEGRCDNAAGVAELAAMISPGLPCFVEIPVRDDPSPLITAIGRAGLHAKIRTGGVTPDAFPPAADVVRFIRRAAELGVAFKATAGLHHPTSGAYRLTDEPSSTAPRGRMFGFLNLLAAAALVLAGADDGVVLRVLEGLTSAEVRWDDDAVGWGGEKVSLHQLRRMRSGLMLSFGSCSFLEPMEGLRTLAFL